MLADGPQGWRWIFYVNVPVGAVAFLLGLRLLPRVVPGHRERLDLRGVALLGCGVLAMMLPLVLAESGGVRRLWWLFPVGAALLMAFAWWERRLAAGGGRPLLHPRLVTSTRGYAVGATIAALYFVGFSGVWLVFALYFQNGQGYSPLRSGLAVTPFALGSAAAAVVAGRLVERLGRLLTVCGLAVVALGLGGAVLALRLASGDTALWFAAPVLFAGGLGSGCVISPNVTMTLRDVPVRMAGAAGGALQTAQRLGGAVGTAALPGLFYVVLGTGRHDYRSAVVIAIGSGIVFILGAFGLAVHDWLRDRRPRPPPRPPEPSHGPSRATRL